MMMLGAAGCVIAHARAHRWLGCEALLLGIALFIPYADFFALLLTLSWIVVVSVMASRSALGSRDAAAGVTA